MAIPDNSKNFVLHPPQVGDRSNGFCRFQPVEIENRLKLLGRVSTCELAIAQPSSDITYAQ
jgi:hypothetical protein